MTDISIENASVLFYTNVSAKKSIPWRTPRVIHLNRMIECKKRKTTIDLEMNLHQGLKGVVIRRFLFVLIFRCTCIFIFQADWNETTKHIKLGFRADIKVPVNGEIERDGIIAPNNELFLFGVLEYDFLQTQVAGKLGMRGMWRKAYTIPWLSFGNIFVG